MAKRATAEKSKNSFQFFYKTCLFIYCLFQNYKNALNDIFTITTIKQKIVSELAIITTKSQYLNSAISDTCLNCQEKVLSAICVHFKQQPPIGEECTE
jgi:hypothetical protein